MKCIELYMCKECYNTFTYDYKEKKINGIKVNYRYCPNCSSDNIEFLEEREVETE